MPPAGKKAKSAAQTAGPPIVGPALLTSTIANEEDLGLVLLFIAGDQNAGQTTQIWPDSTVRSNLGESAYPFFLHSIYAGLVPPFSDFFYAILSHYRIHALHL
jgi:hypothetical protein